ncbi:hypothetical protein DV515_00004073 [Chloebia gouldiae]|uniref:Uncharacterized protein n=1 Tax=Chloebia gouldiae TaxID=44316 RepID=A0A3L8SRG7_CHLGU|nr:hypothetical protein DV515_00004073 [Chloebia gouldiae]
MQGEAGTALGITWVMQDLQFTLWIKDACGSLAKVSHVLFQITFIIFEQAYQQGTALQLSALQVNMKAMRSLKLMVIYVTWLEIVAVFHSNRKMGYICTT